MTTIILYGRRNTAQLALSFLVAKGFKVKVITDDFWVTQLANSLNVEECTLDNMGEFDIFISVHGNKIVPMKYLEGKIAFNCHPCLGKYKGHNPIKRYLENKDVMATVDSHFMVEEADMGEVIVSVPFATGQISTYAEFYNEAVPFYFTLFERSLNKLNIKP